MTLQPAPGMARTRAVRPATASPAPYSPAPYSHCPASTPIEPQAGSTIRRRTLPALAVGLLTSLAAPLVAQQLPPGYQQATQGLPLSQSLTQRLSTGASVQFDGTDLQLLLPSQPPQTLLQFATPVFASFVVELDTQFLLFGENLAHTLWLVPLQGPALPVQLGTLQLNYAAVRFATNQVLISARTGGWSSSDNHLYLLDVTTASPQLLATFPGASGPLAIGPGGDVYYATASPLFPSPAGTVEILRLRRTVVDQALLTQQVLGRQDAELVWAGLDAASALAFDDDGDLLFVDWWQNRIGELNDAHRSTPWVSTAIDYGTSPVGPAALQFVPGGGAGEFEPFQPDNGVLLIHETDWSTTNQVRAVAAQPPTATIVAPDPIPTGPFTLQCRRGPAGGLGLLAFAFGAAPAPLAVAVPGLEATVPWDGAFATGLHTAFVGFDGLGSAALTLQNPGSPVPVPLQALLVTLDGTLTVVGGARPLPFRLGQ